jgi:hypothetical protein
MLVLTFFNSITTPSAIKMVGMATNETQRGKICQHPWKFELNTSSTIAPFVVKILQIATNELWRPKKITKETC